MSDRRVLVLGGSGLLGRHLMARLPESFARVTAAPRDAIEATQPDTVAAQIAQARPDVIVNAIGVRPGTDVALMTIVNGAFPHALAACAEQRGATVVQISSDAVFSGRRGSYTEDDAADPVDAYGESKLRGELQAPHLTIRTSFFGCSGRGAGLIDWLTSQRGRTVDGYVDYLFTGIAAGLLADLIALAIARRLSGVYHVGGDAVSKHDLIVAVARRLQLNLIVNPVRRGSIDRTLASGPFFSAVARPRPTLAESLDALTPWACSRS